MIARQVFSAVLTIFGQMSGDITFLDTLQYKKSALFLIPFFFLLHCWQGDTQCIPIGVRTNQKKM